jgi:Zn-finger nucleic acid-binding protein
MKCPACKDVTLTMSERNGVEIDYCPDCRGVWLDRGELDKIIEKMNPPHQNLAQEGGFTQQPQAQHPHAPYPNPYYKQKRKKSFLEEIFD